MNIALIQAGGIGKRTNNDVPKQFICVYDKPIIIYTLEVFQKNPKIDGIVVICLDGWHDALRAYCKQYGITKIESIVSGGETGFKSLQKGLQDIAKRHSPETMVLIHEAVRPLVSEEILSDALKIAETYGDSVASLACIDEIIGCQDGVSGLEMTQRDDHYSIQNPHTFPLSKLLWAYEEAERKGLSASLGTAVLMYELGSTLHLSKGSARNFKITLHEDIEMFKALLKCENK